jgi:hypothetical protein
MDKVFSHAGNSGQFGPGFSAGGSALKAASLKRAGCPSEPKIATFVVVCRDR